VPAAPASPRIRLTAAARREQIVTAATTEFALRGLHGTSTETIAREAGISHAYLFRLFPTKKDLFVACARAACERTQETLRSAVAGTPEDDPASRLAAMGRAYVAMLQDRELLMAQMQMWVACAADDELREVGRDQYGRVYHLIVELSGADPDMVRGFIAHGMLLNVAAALELEETAATAPYVRDLLPHLRP
jgi:AcrR family transcriptional regulator